MRTLFDNNNNNNGIITARKPSVVKPARYYTHEKEGEGEKKKKRKKKEREEIRLAEAVEPRNEIKKENTNKSHETFSADAFLKSLKHNAPNVIV